MRQEENYTYKDFYREVAVKPSKTEKLQREELLSNIEKLYSQRDFWSLETLLEVTRHLTNEEEVDKGYTLYFILRDLTTGELNQIFTIYKEKTQTTGNHLDGLWDAIGTAFYMGYAVGRRASKA